MSLLKRSAEGAAALSALSLAIAPGMGTAQAAAPAAAGGGQVACTPASFAAGRATITRARRIDDAGVPRCRVEGVVVTTGEGAPDGQVRFGLDLPDRWNGRFLFVGSGGYGGVVIAPPADALKRGYAVVGSNSGHDAPPTGDDLTWATLPNGERSMGPIADFQYRGQHQVNAAVRPLVRLYYGRAPDKAIFMGCSGGGRQALLEAQNHTADYDGYVALAPAFETTSSFSRVGAVRAFSAAPIARDRIEAVGAAFIAQCDALDGVKDSLVQNPAACAFDTKSLVGRGVLSPAQAKALQTYLSALRDTRGRRAAFGYPISDLAYPGAGVSAYMPDRALTPGAREPWGDRASSPSGWRLGQPPTSRFIFNQPDMDVLGPEVFAADGVLTARAVALAQRHMGPDIPDPNRLGPFFASGRKMIIVHGWADQLLTPYATIDAYQTMTRVAGGEAAASRSLRLFMAPEMQHCRGGSGPNRFDALAAMEAWLDTGVAPASLLVTKYTTDLPPGLQAGFAQDNPEGSIQRTMPVCAHPALAAYDGHGDVLKASSWSCRAGDRRGARIGPVGRQAGL